MAKGPEGGQPGRPARGFISALAHSNISPPPPQSTNKYSSPAKSTASSTLCAGPSEYRRKRVFFPLSFLPFLVDCYIRLKRYCFPHRQDRS